MKLKEKISSNWLLSIYLIVPLILCISLFDSYFLNGGLRPLVNLQIDSNRVFLAFFIYPHVLMSLLTLWDKEYWDSYKKEVFSVKILPYLLLIPFGLFYTGPFEIIFLFLTIKHFLGQQMGIETLLSKTDKVYSCFSKYFLLSIIFIFYGAHVLPSELFFTKLLISIKDQIIFSNQSPILLSFFSLIILIDAYLRGEKSKTFKGQLYVWFNGLTLLAIFFTFKLGYPFLGLLIPRFIMSILVGPYV